MLRRLFLRPLSPTLNSLLLSSLFPISHYQYCSLNRASILLSTSRVTTKRNMGSLPRTPLFEAITSHDPKSVAVVHCLSGRSFTYGHLVKDVAATKERIAKDAGRDAKGIEGERIAFVVENGYDYVVALLSILASNAIAVPLAPAFPVGELRYILDQSQAIMLISSARFSDKADETLKEGLENHCINSKTEKIVEGGCSSHEPVLEDVGNAAAKSGMMLYTSGTTNRPKGVLLPQTVMTAQAKSLYQAWSYTTKDHFLHILPLHHIHGTINALLTPLLAGSTIEFLFPFNVDHVWNRLASPFLAQNGDTPKALRQPITFLTCVPTVYNRMLQSHATLSEPMKQAIAKALKPSNLRLNISGSAALPTPTKKAWTNLSGGNILLERYGMTEVGMALSCGLAWEDRVDGSVGWPLPSVQARLVDTDSHQVIPETDETDAEGRERVGEIQLKGPTIFPQYWRNPTATKSEFTDDGWFKTGDVAFRRTVPTAGKGNSGDWAKGPMWFIQGRRSADIIKTGGEKVSALEVEREILSLPQVAECAVVALPSEAWGQKVAAVVMLNEMGRTSGKGGKPFSALDLRKALKDALVSYKIPQDMKVVESIPRNAMGKVNKKALVESVFGNAELIRKRSIDKAREREERMRMEKEVHGQKSNRDSVVELNGNGVNGTNGTSNGHTNGHA